MASKATLENALRDELLEVISKALEAHYETDILTVSTSKLTLPLVDAEGNEKFGLITVTIPRGTRVNGTYEPYDGYAVAEEYRLEREAKEEEKKAKAAEKEAEEKRKAEKRSVKKAIKNLEKAVEGVA